MSDTLVEFKTAKLAKKKGFNDNTYSNCWVKTLDGEIIHNSQRKNIIEHDRCSQYLMQPTQTHLRNFLRDVHNIHIIVTPVMCKLNPAEVAWFTYEIKGKAYMDSIGTYSTYGYALENALYDGLKLIKKEKKWKKRI